MCKGDGECVNHLLLHCQVARESLNFLFHVFHISWVMPMCVNELFLSWSLFKRRRSCTWDTLPLGSVGLFGMKESVGCLIARRRMLLD